MKPITGITLDGFKALVRGIAAERPDFIYNQRVGTSCYYAPTVRSSTITSRCIIGEALSRLGFTDEELYTFDNTPGNRAENILAAIGFSYEIRYWAATVQRAQDSGYAWGEAVKGRADR